jgi:hypothetical protein
MSRLLMDLPLGLAHRAGAEQAAYLAAGAYGDHCSGEV